MACPYGQQLKRLRARRNFPVDNESVSSKCTARITPQVNRHTYSLCFGTSLQCNGLAKSMPTIENAEAWVTFNSGRGATNWLHALASCLRQGTHSHLTCLTRRLRHTIQYLSLSKGTRVSTPAWLSCSCWDCTNNNETCRLEGWSDAFPHMKDPTIEACLSPLADHPYQWKGLD